MNVSYIKMLMERQNMTQTKLSELTDIPATTLSKILNGSTDSPSFSNIAAIVKVLGGSLDVMVGIVSAPDAEPIQASERQLYQQLLADKERQLRSLNGMLEQKQHWLHKLWRALMVTVGIIGILLIADMCIGSIGFIRYLTIAKQKLACLFWIKCQRCGAHVYKTKYGAYNDDRDDKRLPRVHLRSCRLAPAGYKSVSG